MTTYYVGSGGSNGNAGTSWALRKLTLNGAEDIPLVAGDIVYVGPGTYRELLTVDVSGSSGNPITYIGDYTGANTDGVGGVVRITGSDNDQTGTRANCVTATTKNYRTFQGFTMDTTTAATINNNGGTNWIIRDCCFNPASSNAVTIDVLGATQANNTIQNCFFSGIYNGNACIRFSHSLEVNNAGHVVQNCIFLGMAAGTRVERVGGIVLKNSIFAFRINQGVQIATALAVGQTITVNNCIFQSVGTALNATVTGEIVEDYNTFFANNVNRTNTATGANSLTYPALLDTRWFFQLVHEGAGPNHTTQVITPFDLSSFSQLINVAGTSPTTTDMRGTAVQGSQREWGALEYDSTLKIEGGGGGPGIFGGMVR